MVVMVLRSQAACQSFLTVRRVGMVAARRSTALRLTRISRSQSSSSAVPGLRARCDDGAGLAPGIGVTLWLLMRFLFDPFIDLHSDRIGGCFRVARAWGVGSRARRTPGWAWRRGQGRYYQTKPKKCLFSITWHFGTTNEAKSRCGTKGLGRLPHGGRGWVGPVRSAGHRPWGHRGSMVGGVAFEVGRPPGRC